MVLGNGEVKWCSRESNSDLFYALPGSFGSLAICTRVRILCLHAKPFVHIVSRLHRNTSSCVQYLTDIQDHTLQQSTTGSILPVVDFMEGIAYDASKVASILASSVSDEERRQDPMMRNLRIRRCNGWGNNWFFNQIKYQFNSLKTLRFFGRKIDDDFNQDIHAVMPIKDYLFRHDQGSFWMASYRIPQFIGRVMGPLLDSSNMFKLATLLPWAFPKHVIALQDCMLPRSRVVSFVADMEALLGVYPLWILPMRNLNDGALFSIPKGLPGHLVNIGIYGIPSKKRYNFREDNIELERILHAHNGRKVFYSHSFYERDFFYNRLYDGKRYFRARKVYHAENIFPEIFDKVVTKAGRL